MVYFEWWYLKKTSLMWLWWVKMPSRDLNDVILVGEDAFKILDWCDSVRMAFRDLTEVTLVSEDEGCLASLSFDESCWWKLSLDEYCVSTKVVFWWKFSINESYLLMKVDKWRKLTTQSVFEKRGRLWTLVFPRIFIKKLRNFWTKLS